ncbi:hypothetical protein ACIQB5_01705 [Streptomyces sp. NPDC088560]|uniref:hypothetical protein n=1 Tax=Streptomyces sp. NPDC088560 TaxID=3365868 RepID=UPI00381CF2AF
MRSVTLRAALRQVARQWQEKVARGTLSAQTADSYITNSERLLRFTLALGLERLDDVTDTLAQAFIDAPGHDRQGRLVPCPADSTRRVRRSSVDALFAEARRLGLTTRAPLLDLPPIPRSQPRPIGTLTDTDVDRLRFYAERGMPQTRHAAVLGLLLSGLHTGEIGLTATTDLDLDNSRVWAVGAARITARYCPLEDPWSREVLRLRVEYVQHQSSCDRPETLTTNGLAPANQLQSSVCTAFGEVVRASGIAPEGRSATPRDVSSWLAAKIHSETGQIADVALRLGLSSLDRAAKLAGYEWRPSGTGA